MTKANECTCPSGDGSLRHPCPAHPASVELAGVAANLTFINGRPAMCGCQVEYSSGGGEYSDVIYVTLCAKHSGSAILDLVATNRIALTPEYEGQWHADLYLDREIPLAKAEGATPAEAVLALMSAERIDPEQGWVEQAGGDERAAFELFVRKHCGMPEHIAVNWDAKFTNDAWEGWQARAALAQHSPAPTLRAAIDIANDRFEAPVAKWGTDLAGEEERPEAEEVSEFEREDIARSAFETAMADGISLDSFLSLSNTLAARYERIVGALRAQIAEWQEAAGRGRSDVVAYIAERAKLLEGRDAALAKLAELEAKLSDPTAVHQWQFSNAWFDGSEEVVLKAGKEGSPIRTLYAAPVAQAQPEETPGEILAAKLIETWVTKHGKPAPWSTAVEITAVATNMPNDERDRLLALDDDVDAQAQHSVPGKYDDVLLPFLKSMEHELHANAGKGDRPGWLQMDRRTALLEIYYHLAKLQKATKDNDAAGIVEYAADVANMSMMLVDVCGVLAAAPGKEEV
ncbi:hypothetical protein [Pseudomonas aeruginosa]|uniref:hypothetical protein n=1 Tax=Pseudomonas aeruginosa TaxID=287 RepID=UPI002498E736|nr:hypothetical protein [Pseudomonas aeruginosa]MDI2425840.1 hypothetical protein [Pseudomonas aeruginosa]